jgi:hypothetical protein
MRVHRLTQDVKLGAAGVVWFVVLLLMGTVNPAYTVSNDDREALIELYLATQGENWDDNSGWKEDPVSSDGFGRRSTLCSWYGVVCGWLAIDLLEIDLSRNNLDGYLDSFNNLPRNAFEELQTLDLSGNHLRGILPAGLEDLDELNSLVLYDNNLSGRIPEEFGSLELGYLNLRGNMLSGPVPEDLEDLDNLEKGSLDLRWNALYTNDEELRTFLDSRQIGGDWQSTQTVAPKNIRIGRSTSSSIEVLWTAVDYLEDEGAYEVSISTVSGGPYTLAATIDDKTVESVEITGLLPRTTYYLSMRTVTYAHPFNKNDVYSELAGEVIASTLDEDLPGISIEDIFVEEQNSLAVFNVILDSVAEFDVSFSYATSSGTATNDQDYIHTEGTGTIPAGQNTMSLEVLVVDDDLSEEEETFFMVLSDPVNAALVVTAAMASIIDDETSVLPESSVNQKDNEPDNVCFITTADE